MMTYPCFKLVLYNFDWMLYQLSHHIATRLSNPYFPSHFPYSSDNFEVRLLHTGLLAPYLFGFSLCVPVVLRVFVSANLIPSTVFSVDLLIRSLDGGFDEVLLSLFNRLLSRSTSPISCSITCCCCSTRSAAN